MTQRTRNIIANVLLGLGLLFIAAFIVEHFTTQPPRPSWHTDLAWIGVACVTARRIVRGQRRAIQT